MESNRGEQGADIARHRSPGLTPLEIWDFEIAGGVVSDYVGTREIGAALREMLVQLHAGDGCTRSCKIIPPACRGFDAVVLTAGGADERLLDARFDLLPFATFCYGPDPFCGEGGGRLILGARASTGAVVDVGQTQIKISISDRRSTYPRDFGRLPVRSHDRPAVCRQRSVARQREALQRYIGRSLRDACRAGGVAPPALVMGLPCEVDEHGALGSSSYIGTEGNGDLVAAVLRVAGLATLEVTLLNDTELAALSIIASPQPQLAGRRVVVITIGFAVGGALLEDRAWQR